MFKPKIVIAPDYLVQYGGAERVLEAFHEIWRQSPIYTSFVDKNVLGLLKIDPENIRTPLLSKIPFSFKFYKHFVPFYPELFKRIDIDADIVISSSTFAAKFISKGRATHICYLHTVPRFLWGYDTELTEPIVFGLDRLLDPLYKKILPGLKGKLKKADYAAAQKVDFFIANSREVQKRIKKHYNRDSVVIYPPVDTARFVNLSDRGSGISNQQDKYFLVVSRLGDYKRIDIVVEAFNKLKLPLKIVGDGPQLPYLKSLAKSNIVFFGRVPEKEKIQLLQNCKALIFPTYEDFGIVPVEAMATGKPVIAFRKGGATETVVEGVTGEFFDEQTPSAIINTLKKFKLENYEPTACRKQAEKFSSENFKRLIKFFVEEAWQNQKNTQ
ncbi:MAG: glycosyltransferase [Candidatus Woykebacteria bacterium]